MSASEQAEMEARIVRAVAACAHDLMDGEWGEREWVHLFVDIEVAAEGDRSSSISLVLCHLPQQGIESESFRLSRDAKQLFRQLADDMTAVNGRRWTSAQLRLERDGRYSQTYSYEPAYRLGGHLLDNRFNNYCAEWLASEAAAPSRPAPKSWWRALLGR